MRLGDKVDGAPWSSRETLLSLVGFAVMSLLVGIFLLRSGPSLITSHRAQVIGHAGASAALTTAIAGTRLARTAKRPDVLFVVGGGAALTIAFELSQALVPVRAVQLEDILNGFGGVLIAAIAIEVVLRVVPLAVSLRLHSIAAGLATTGLLGIFLTSR